MGLVLPKGSATFLYPQATPMGGLTRTSPSCGTSYTVGNMMGKSGWENDCTLPCLFKNGDKGWVLISEAEISNAYCGSRLLEKGSGPYIIDFP